EVVAIALPRVVREVVVAEAPLVRVVPRSGEGHARLDLGHRLGEDSLQVVEAVQRDLGRTGRLVLRRDDGAPELLLRRARRGPEPASGPDPLAVQVDMGGLADGGPLRP